MSRPHLRDPKLEYLWRTRLTRWTASELNIRDFCRRYQLAETAFYFWRREIAARDRSPAPPPTARRSAARRTSTPPSAGATRRSSTPRRTSPPDPRPTFVPVRVVADTPLELVLRSGHVVRVPPGYDARHLRAVVAALEGDPC